MVIQDILVTRDSGYLNKRDDNTQHGHFVFCSWWQSSEFLVIGELIEVYIPHPQEWDLKIQVIQVTVACNNHNVTKNLHLVILL